jgi:hypothetical protein
MTNKFTTLDHIDGITVPGNPFAEPANEYYALLWLRTGLRFLYIQVAKYDQIARAQLDPSKQYFCFGNSPLLKGIPYDLLNCAFHWYSISACQYVNTVGAIACLQDKSHPKPPKYVESIIPEVKTFRDKVAAHFAWSSRNKRDNDAERLASIIPQVTFFDDTFQVQMLTATTVSKGKVSSSQEMQPWSVTKIHQRLQKRYWPEDLETDTAVLE